MLEEKAPMTQRAESYLPGDATSSTSMSTARHLAI